MEFAQKYGYQNEYLHYKINLCGITKNECFIYNCKVTATNIDLLIDSHTRQRQVSINKKMSLESLKDDVDIKTREQITTNLFQGTKVLSTDDFDRDLLEKTATQRKTGEKTNFVDFI